MRARHNEKPLPREGKGLLVAFVRPECVAPLLDADGPDVLASIRPDLDRAFPGRAGRIERVRIYRWREGIPVFYPGFLAHLGLFRDGSVERDGAVALAGDYLVSPTMEGAVSAGLAAADRVLARLTI